MQHVVSDDVRYLHFDFHHICGHIHFERLSMLYDQIEDFLVKNRYLLLNEKSEKVEEQLGVVRTNCIDCLDRTNVTQSMLGRKMLEFQLRRIGIFDAEESISTHPNFDDNFKICEYFYNCHRLICLWVDELHSLYFYLPPCASYLLSYYGFFRMHHIFWIVFV
ncbi:hypothetical protein CsSME_00016322 [Camellia sinensis var. sinensis]